MVRAFIHRLYMAGIKGRMAARVIRIDRIASLPEPATCAGGSCIHCIRIQDDAMSQSPNELQLIAAIEANAREFFPHGTATVEHSESDNR